MAEWRQIDSAPKDGTRLLLYGRGRAGKLVTLARWHTPSRPGYPGSWISAHAMYDPTHWMPLPPAPKDAGHD